MSRVLVRKRCFCTQPQRVLETLWVNDDMVGLSEWARKEIGKTHS
jgi:hypothetical protein